MSKQESKTTIGRVGEKGVYIGRGSPFGNPFKIGRDGTRKEVIEKYRNHFYYKLNYDYDVFRKQVKKLKGKHLICHCKPKACHGDVIAEYLNRETK